MAQIVEGSGERGGGRRALAPIGVGTAARHQSKLPHRRVHSGNSGRAGQHDDAPIEEFADLHAPLCIGAALGAARDLDDAGPQAHGVVAGDDAPVAATEDEGEIARRAAPDRLGR